MITQTLFCNTTAFECDSCGMGAVFPDLVVKADKDGFHKKCSGVLEWMQNLQKGGWRFVRTEKKNTILCYCHNCDTPTGSIKPPLKNIIIGEDLIGVSSWLPEELRKKSKKI